MSKTILIAVILLIGCAVSRQNAPSRVYGVLYLVDWSKDKIYQKDSGYAEAWFSERGNKGLDTIFIYQKDGTEIKMLNIAAFRPYKKKYEKHFGIESTAMFHFPIIK